MQEASLRPDVDAEAFVVVIEKQNIYIEEERGDGF